jgi:hypothetical protein
MAFARFMGPVHPVQIQLSGFESVDVDVPDIAGLVQIRIEYICFIGGGIA